MSSRSSWPQLLNFGVRNSGETQGTPPKLRTQQTQFTLLTDSNLQHHQRQQSCQLPQYSPGNSLGVSADSFTGNHQQSRLGYTTFSSDQPSPEPIFSNESPLENTRTLAESPVLWGNWKDFENNLAFTGNEELSGVNQRNDSSTNKYLKQVSLFSIDNENDWISIDRYSRINALPNNTAIFNPSQTLHLRTNSDSSNSDCTAQTVDSYFSQSYEGTNYSYSPGSEGYLNYAKDCHCSDEDVHQSNCHSQIHVDNTRPSTPMGPVLIKMSSLSMPNSPTFVSQPVRRNSAPRKSSLTKTTKPTVRRTSSIKKDSEKRVGRRRGPLLPEQRKQASEIRKLRACLRCKFLKKTCDKGEPCAGCQPSHARLWQVPCTRIDIKDIGYFMKDWNADYERLTTSSISLSNIKGFAQSEQLIWITHGYGFAIPIMTREVYLVDESCLIVSWVESFQSASIKFDTPTERISVGTKGISPEILSEYLDLHVDATFEIFINNFFEGTPFITGILNTVHRYYMKEKVPVIQKALKLILAYNLTLHITFVEQHGYEHGINGLVRAEKSKFYSKIITPVMINLQIKYALASIWRGLKSDVLAELSTLYSSVYSGDRLKNWPTILMLVSVLLILWEEMQFDTHYRMPDPIAAQKFCSDMEAIPVGVLIGLFHAISQKLPSFTDWDTPSHGQLLNNNRSVCEFMSDLRSHVIKHETYLRARSKAQFNPHDLDSLSNKLLSKLVIRAN